MSGSRDQMLRLLQEAKATVRSRIPDMPNTGHRHASRRPRHGQSGEGKEADAAGTSGSPPAEGSTTADAVKNKLDAKEHTMEFLHLYFQIFRSFVLDPTKFNLPLEGLDGSARRVLHLLAERCNLDHQSDGTGDTRAIMIKKGPLFYQYQDAYQTVDLERIATEVNSKSSKFELKRAVRLKGDELTSGVIGSYDEDTLRKVQRFQRSTDEYRHAVDMGYSQDDLQRLESDDITAEATDKGELSATLSLATTGRRLEQLLSRPAEGDALDQNLAAQDVVGRARGKNTPSPPPPSHVPPPSSTEGEASRPSPAALSAGAAPAKPTMTYEETCRGCWTRVPLLTAIRDWRCSKYCTQCGKDTIWMLRPVVAEPAPAESAKTDTAAANAAGGTGTAEAKAEAAKGGASDGVRHKRRRDGNGDGGSASDDASSDDDDEAAAEKDLVEEEEEPLHVEDVVEMANGNDLEACDVTWLRHFCTAHADHLPRHVVFCIDLADLQQLPIFQRPAQQARRHQQQRARRLAKRARTDDAHDAPTSATAAAPDSTPQYVVVRASTSIHMSLASLLDKVLTAAFCTRPASAEGDVGPQPLALDAALRHVAVAMPNASVYGTEALAIVQLRPGALSDDQGTPLAVNSDALAALEKEFGARHVHLLADLDAAIKEAE